MTESIATLQPYSRYIVAFAMCIAGFIVGNFLGRLVERLPGDRLHAQTRMLLGKGVRFTILLTVFFSALSHAGMNLTALLGAAGIAGVAVGFASQASLSNLVCGFFLVIERPFQIGDLIEVDGTLGSVDTIGVLSTFIRAYDNRLIRIPNEAMMKAKITNVANFPIRRADLPVSVAYAEDPARVMRLLREVCDANPICLDEPEPLILFTGIGKTSLDFTVCAWVDKRNFLVSKNSLLCDIKACFDREKIIPAYPPFVAHVNPDEAGWLNKTRNPG